MMIPNYGYVPFGYFQYIAITTQILLIVFSESVNNFMYRYFDKENVIANHLRRIILSIPIILIGYYDVMYSSFALKNLIDITDENKRKLDNVLMVLGAYGFIQMLGQDAGMRSSEIQTKASQNPMMFVAIAIGLAYSITQNHSFSMTAVMLYYHLRYVIGE